MSRVSGISVHASVQLVESDHQGLILVVQLSQSASVLSGEGNGFVSGHGVACDEEPESPETPRWSQPVNIG